MRQLEMVDHPMPARLATQTPVLAGTDAVCYLDIDSCRRRGVLPCQAGRGVRVRHGRWLLGAAVRAWMH